MIHPIQRLSNRTLNQEEVVRLLKAAPGRKYKAAFGVAYGAGLRVSEVIAPKVSDTNSKRMMKWLSSRSTRCGIL